MYQVTFIDCGELFSVTFHRFREAEALYWSLERKAQPRMWSVGDTNEGFRYILI